MALIEKDVKTIEELKTVIGHGGKAAVLYDANTGEPYGLDVEVLIAMDASIGNKVDKVAGKSLILDTEIARLATVTNQTLGGLGGEAAANKQDSLAVDGHGIKFPTVDAVNLGLATKPAKTVQVVAGAGITGGGTLEADRTLNVVSANDGITVNADNIQLNVVDGLESTSATQPLSAKQGKALNDSKVDKVAGKSLILDTEISRLATVTNQTKQTLGIENVDNTSDAAKPISTATQTALNGKVNTTDIEQVRSQATNKVASSKLLDDELNTIEGLIDTLENRADAAESDITVNTADIRLLENTINSANINQETTATVTGVDTIALPKTAANTGMQVQLFGQSAQNLVENGDFRNGNMSWNRFAYTTAVTGQLRIVRALSDPSNDIGMWQSVNSGNIGDKLYIKFNFTGSIQGHGLTTRIANYGTPNSSISNAIQGLTISVGTYVDTRLMSAITTLDRNKFSLSTFMFTAQGIHTVDLTIDNIFCINLTATFGAGNEPTKEQCDLLFANYFEGMDNVLGTGRVRSVGRNLLDSSKFGKRIWSGQTDGLTTAQRYVYYDIIVGGTRDSIISIATINRYSIEGDKVIVSNSSGGYGVTFKFKAIAGKRYYKSAVLSSGVDGVGIGIFDKLGNLLVSSKTAFIDAPANSSFGVLCLTSDTFNTDITYTNVGVFETSLPAIYEPYRQSSLYLTTPELRSNGLTKDEIRKGTNGYELVRRINPADGTVLVTPLTMPIQHAGLLNSNSNGTVYFEPIIADAGVYGSNLSVQLTDYPISSFESIRKYANGTYTELNTATAIIASGGLSFTHPDLVSGDLVMFTYAYSKESIRRSMTLTHYDSRFVETDTANGKVYRIVPVVTNGVVSWTAVEV